MNQRAGFAFAGAACATCLISVSFFSMGCSRWEKNVVRGSMRFERLRHSKSGSIIGRLADDTVIQGYPCSAGWAHFYSDWRLKDFMLVSPMTINGVSVPADTWVSLEPEGDLRRCAFPDDTTVQGFTCIGTGGSKGCATAFYESGRLKYFFSPENLVIKGIPCKGGQFSIIGLHENGRVMTCKLSEKITIGKKMYRKGKNLSFDDKGNVVGGE